MSSARGLDPGGLSALLLGYVLLFERTSVTSKELDARAGAGRLGTFVRAQIASRSQRCARACVLERKPLEDGHARRAEDARASRRLLPIRTRSTRCSASSMG